MMDRRVRNALVFLIVFGHCIVAIATYDITRPNVTFGSPRWIMSTFGLAIGCFLIYQAIMEFVRRRRNDDGEA